MKTEIKLAQINGQEITIIENGQKLVPLKPICEALGIDWKSQYDKVKNDEILSSTMVLSTIVAPDGKDRETSCLPLKYVFGWLFTINPKNVSPEAAESVIKYKNLCYDVLYEYFSERSEFMEIQKQLVDEQLDKVAEAKVVFQTTKTRLDEEQKKLEKVRHFTFAEWKYNNKQLSLF